MVRRNLQGRFDAHHNQLRVGGPDVVHSRRCGGVAGDDQGFQGVLRQKLSHSRQGQRPDFFCGAAAVGSVGGVAIVDKPLSRQNSHQMPQHADAAYAGIKYGNIIVFLVHDLT